MGIFTRFRDIVASNINGMLDRAEDPEKLLRALIREMEDASEEARMACAELLAEQQRLQRLERRLDEDIDQWQSRAEQAISQDRDDLARAALKARTELAGQLEAAKDEQQRVAERVGQMEQDIATLKVKRAEAKTPELTWLKRRSAASTTAGSISTASTLSTSS